MNLSIHDELAKLQNELTTLEQAVKHISKAEQISTSVIKTTEAVQKNYAIHLKNLLDLLEKSVSHLQQELKNKLEKFDTDSEKILTAYQTQINEISKILDSYSDLVSRTQHFLDKLNKIDFPMRLDKLDLTISGINQSVLNALMRVETLERNVKDENKNLLVQIESQDKKNQSHSSTSLITIGFINWHGDNAFPKLILYCTRLRLGLFE
ncbi:hypothetical protein BGP_3077 [Beggiatoa sp. PS]|nr:hypothetical protein BGP_3077 [Beggiatoa sp. PS]